MYEPSAMALALLKAQETLDRAMDAALGGRRKLATEEDRLTALFKLYVDMAS